MSAAIDVIGTALAMGGREWVRADGTRPSRTQQSRLRGAAISGENNRARAYGGFARVPEDRGMGDDWSGIVAFDARDARRCRRMGLRPMPCPRGVLPDGVQVFVRDPENAPRDRK
jgi:hypothetical protein